MGCGAWTSARDYYPYGDERVHETQGSGTDNRFDFTNKERDDESGLMYVEARYLSTDAARFISIDPLFLEVSNEDWIRDPQMQNAYSYARNNPIKYIDPNGEIAFLAMPAAPYIAAGIAAIGAGIAAMMATQVIVDNPPAINIHTNPIPQVEIGSGILGGAVGAVSSGTVTTSPIAGPSSGVITQSPSTTGGQVSGCGTTITCAYAPNRPLPRNEHGIPVVDPGIVGPHSQLGVREGRAGSYRQAREFDANGNPVRDIDFTDHGRPGEHSNPHQHRYNENETGGSSSRGTSEPLN